MLFEKIFHDLNSAEENINDNFRDSRISSDSEGVKLFFMKLMMIKIFELVPSALRYDLQVSRSHNVRYNRQP